MTLCLTSCRKFRTGHLTVLHSCLVSSRRRRTSSPLSLTTPLGGVTRRCSIRSCAYSSTRLFLTRLTLLRTRRLLPLRVPPTLSRLATLARTVADTFSTFTITGICSRLLVCLCRVTSTCALVSTSRHRRLLTSLRSLSITLVAGRTARTLWPELSVSLVLCAL